MPRKKRKSAKDARGLSMQPPLTAEAEVAYYALEEERGVYDELWRNMGYYLERGVDFPPYSRDQKRRNNRASSWNGTFSFTFVILDAGLPEREELFRSLVNDYQCALVEGSMSGQWEGQARLNGKRVKTLTRLLNRRFSRGHLVWKEY